jgi:CheY-like chemotaxis protein
MRILIVEDVHDVAQSLRRLLSRCGYEVRVAHTGAEGVRLAQEWLPDVVMCDIGLPGMDGHAVAIQLRAHPAMEQARLVALTADDSDATRRRSQEVGFEAHLVKPIDVYALLELLETTSLFHKIGRDC